MLKNFTSGICIRAWALNQSHNLVKVSLCCTCDMHILLK
jgi:hypothetical protein